MKTDRRKLHLIGVAACLAGLLLACLTTKLNSNLDSGQITSATIMLTRHLKFSGQAPRPTPVPPPPGLVGVADVIPGIALDVRYATADNFTGEVLDGYRAPRVFLRPKTASALRAVQEALAPSGLRLKIFDGYRPLRAERHMARWARAAGREDLLRDGLVPSGVSAGRRFGHACGNAVDLTLVDGAGRELDMGTGFDDFTRASWTESASGPVRANRLRLKRAMERGGFKNFAREWWHYNFYAEPGAALDVEIR